MDKKDWNFLLLLAAIALVVGAVLFYFYSPTNSISTVLCILGTLLTTIGFIFTIHLQLKIKKTSEQIKLHSDGIYTSIKKDLSLYHFTKAIALAGDIQEKLLYKDYHSTLTLIKQLQGTLIECNKIYSVDLVKHLNACSDCIDTDGKTFSQMVQECKDKSEAESNEEIKRISQKLSSHSVKLNTQLSSNNNIFVPEILVQDLENLKTILDASKPTVLNLFS